MIFSQIQSARNSIAFIEKTYRRREPKYADFSIRQQQEIIRRLTEEGKRSQCRPTGGLEKTKKKGQRP